MGDRVALATIRDGNRYLAGRLRAMGRDILYRRPWGGLTETGFFHFESCHYRTLVEFP